jgi:hypothetical protein
MFKLFITGSVRADLGVHGPVVKGGLECALEYYRSVVIAVRGIYQGLQANR